MTRHEQCNKRVWLKGLIRPNQLLFIYLALSKFSPCFSIFSTPVSFGYWFQRFLLLLFALMYLYDGKMVAAWVWLLTTNLLEFGIQASCQTTSWWMRKRCFVFVSVEIGDPSNML